MDGIWLARPDEVGAGEPVAVKDLLDTAGLDDDVRLRLVRRPRSGGERRRRPADRGRRLRRRREDESPRVRVRDLVAERALRHGCEPGRAGTAGGRVERGIRCRDRRRRRRARARERLRGIDPDPGGVVRQRRLQADAWARLGRGLLPARAELRRRRPDGVDGRGVRAADRGRLPPASSRSRSSRSRSSKSVSPGSIAQIRSCGREWRRPPRSSPATRDRVAAGPRQPGRLHARGRRRPPRAVPGQRGAVRRERPRQDRALPAGDGMPRRRRPSASGPSTASASSRPPVGSISSSRRPCCSSLRRRTRTSSRCAYRQRTTPIRSARSAGRRSRSLAARRRTGCPPPSSSPPRGEKTPRVLAAGRLLESSLRRLGGTRLSL